MFKFIGVLMVLISQYGFIMTGLIKARSDEVPEDHRLHGRFKSALCFLGSTALFFASLQILLDNTFSAFLFGISLLGYCVLVSFFSWMFIPVIIDARKRSRSAQTNTTQPHANAGAQKEKR